MRRLPARLLFAGHARDRDAGPHADDVDVFCYDGRAYLLPLPN